MKTSDAGKAAIKREEGYRQYAYPDPASQLAKATRGVRWGFSPARDIIEKLPEAKRNLKATPWTVGFGQTKDVDIDTVMTNEEADADLEKSLPHYEAAVINSTMRGGLTPPTQGQFDALVCLAWNCEVAVSPTSSIIKAHNRGDYKAASKAFELYNKSNGVPNEALMARRKREGLAYLDASPQQEVGDYENLMPQTVDPEKPLSRSKINIASATGGTVATLGAIHETLDAVKQFQDDVTSIKTYLMPLAFVAIVVLCGVVIWQRVGLRKDGVV